MIWFLIALALTIIMVCLIGAVLDLKDKKTKKQFIVLACFLLIIGAGIGATASSITFVPAGHVGIHDLFGDVSADEFYPGLNFKNPFAKVQMMKTQTIELKERSEVPSKEGLIVRLDTSILIRIIDKQADEIYRKIGANYVDVVVTPQLRSVIREVTSSYEAKALYTTARLNVTVDIFNELYGALYERGIILEKVLLRDLGLPVTLTNAIEMKLTAEQEIEQKQFEVKKEEQEAQRKRVEAQGIADANEIIAESLTSNYLRWYWIENLDSHNSVYYVPVDVEDGLPLFKTID